MDAPARDEPGSQDPALTRALQGLLAEGVLSAEQVARVTTARNDEAAAEVSAHPGEALPDLAPPPRSAGGARLPEVLGYLGGTFVVAAALLVLGWSWESFSNGTRLVITTLSALVVYGAGLAIALGAAGGRETVRHPDQDVRRRLVGVLLVIGSFLAAGIVVLLFDGSVEIVLLPIAVVALVLTAVAVRLVPGNIPTLGLFVATVMLAAAPVNLPDDVPALVWVLLYLALGIVWVVLGPWVTSTLAAALFVGLADLVVTGWVAAEFTVYTSDLGSPDHEWGEQVVAPLGFAVLAVLTILGVALYLRGRPWPWLVAATISAAVLVFQMAGDAFGPAVAALVLGALLLAASGLLIVRRGRAEALDVARADVEVA